MGKKEQSCFSHPYHIVSQAGPQPSGEEATERGGGSEAVWVIFWQMVCVSGFGSGTVGGRRHPRTLDATTELPVSSSNLELKL